MGSIETLKRKRPTSPDSFFMKRTGFGQPVPMASYSYRRRNLLRSELGSLATLTASSVSPHAAAAASVFPTFVMAPLVAVAVTSDAAEQISLSAQTMQQQQQTPQQLLPEQALPSPQPIAVTSFAPPPAIVVAVASAATAALPPSQEPNATSSTEMFVDLAAGATAAELSSDDVAPTPPLVDQAVATMERRSGRGPSPRSSAKNQTPTLPKTRFTSTLATTRARRGSTAN